MCLLFKGVQQEGISLVYSKQQNVTLNIILLPEKRKKEIELEIEGRGGGGGGLTRGAFLTILTYRFIGGTVN